jgi:hypothetical protein
MIITKYLAEFTIKIMTHYVNSADEYKLTNWHFQLPVSNIKRWAKLHKR